MSRFPDADKLCALLLREAGISHPPTDLGAVSSLWPNLRVSEEALDKEGYLIFLGAQGAELILRRRDPPNRKRFTFAHELGHWVLSNMQDGELSFDNTVRVVRSTHSSRYTPEETWCNEFAGNLLMPTSEIRRYFQGDAWDVPSRLVAGHGAFHVSEQAFLSRVADALGWIVVELIHGQDLHRVGRRFIRRKENRSTVDQAVEGLLEQTRGGVPFPSGCIRVPGFMAYGIPRTVTRQASTYWVCLVDENSSGVSRRS